MAEDLSKSSPEELGAETNSALNRAPSEGLPSFGSDAEFTKEHSNYRNQKPQEETTNIGRRARDIASKVGERAQDYGQKAIEGTGSFVRDYPVSTLAGCFGVGIALGFALGRR